MESDIPVIMLAENAPSGLVLFDRERDVIFVNTFFSSRLGYANGELTGKSFFDLLLRDDASRKSLYGKLQDCGRKPFENHRLIMHKKTHGTLSVSVSGAPFSNNGRTYIACVISDMTSQEAYEKVIEAGYDNLQQVTIDLETAMRKNREQQRMLEAYKEKISRELDIAKSVQEAIVPREFPKSNCIDVWAVSLASDTLGGDFYDFVRIDKEKIGILIADVAGHGVAASLLTTMLKAYFENYAMKYTQPDRLLFAVNNSLSRLVKETGIFVTALYFVLDLRSLTITGCNAGHEPAIILGPGNGDTDRLGDGTDSMALGLAENTKYPAVSKQLAEGSQLVFFTDGILEARSSSGEFFGYERFLAKLVEQMAYPARRCLESVIDSTDAFYGGSRPNDDRTIIRLDILHRLAASAVDEKEQLFKAKNLLAKRRYDEALAELKLADKENDYSVHIQRLMGKAYAMIKDYPHAEECLIRSIEADDSSSESYYNLGIVKYYEKQYDQAAECFRKVVALSGEYKKTGRYLEFINRILGNGR